MPEISIEIEGIEKALSRLDERKVRREMNNAMRDVVNKVHHDITDYPPELPNQVYVRKGSGGLGGSFTTKVKTSLRSVKGIVGSVLGYVPWVVSDAFQASIHRGRWKTDRQVLEKNAKYFEKRLRAAVLRVLNGYV